MPPDENAALVEPAESNATFDDGADLEKAGEAKAESAPAQGKVEDLKAESTPADEGTKFVEDVSPDVQARINKITADKYGEKNRADAAEAKIAELQAQAPIATPTAKPNADDFDSDNEYHEALIDFKVEQKANAIAERNESRQQERNKQDVQKQFNVKVAVLTEKVPDYAQAVAQLPPLPGQVLSTIMQAENGPELALYLARHMDVADQIATGDAGVGLMMLGEISAKLGTGKPQPRPSAAPDPIEPIKPGGKTSEERGPKGATFE